MVLMLIEKGGIPKNGFCKINNYCWIVISGWRIGKHLKIKS
jgi:hypothetical protein